MSKAAGQTKARKTTKAQAKAPVAKRNVKKAAAVETEDEGEEKVAHSVVNGKYKQRYAERGDARNCGDWLAKTLKDVVLDDDGHLDVAKLQKIAAANGVSPDYPNRSKGWEGRMRMTIGLRMRPVVAAEGKLYVPEGRGKKALPAPRAFVQAWAK